METSQREAYCTVDYALEQGREAIELALDWKRMNTQQFIGKYGAGVTAHQVEIQLEEAYHAIVRAQTP